VCLAEGWKQSNSNTKMQQLSKIATHVVTLRLLLMTTFFTVATITSHFTSNRHKEVQGPLAMKTIRIYFVTLFFASFAVSSSFAWVPPTPPSSQTMRKAAIAVVCGWTLATGVASAAGDVAKGQVVFDNNCAACHVGGQNLINAPRTLQQNAIVKNLGSLDPMTVQDFVQNLVVHRGAFILGSKLSSNDFENVVSYVVDQASNDKWGGK